MKDAYGKEIQVGDTIYVGQRTGRYSKGFRAVKATVTDVKPNQVKFEYIDPSPYYAFPKRKAWKKKSSQVVVG